MTDPDKDEVWAKADSVHEICRAYEAGLGAALTKHLCCPYTPHTASYYAWRYGYKTGVQRKENQNRRTEPLPKDYFLRYDDEGAE